MAKRIFYDGLNLGLEQGTGIATYTRVLAKIAQQLGYEVGVLYGSRAAVIGDPALREISFFDNKPEKKQHGIARPLIRIVDYCRCVLPIPIVRLEPQGIVDGRQCANRVPPLDFLFLARDIFKLARYRFEGTGRFVPLRFPVQPDIMHCTWQVPLYVPSAANICTIHDLVPLRLPFATLANKHHTFRLLKNIAARADHIVTVSERSRNDIVKILGVDEKRITNTYQAVDLPAEYVERGEDVVSRELAGAFGLDFRGYLLFFGAIEPKKNVRRLLEAYHAAKLDIPLVVVSSGGWGNDAERLALAWQRDGQARSPSASDRRRVVHLDYLDTHQLWTLIKGARAVVFPSLYEGFGLPVLEAMVLGTPVLTSREGSLQEIAGDAALLVDAYDVDDIARAMAKIAADEDLCAELAGRGRQRADFFSLTRYRERVAQLYATVG